MAKPRGAKYKGWDDWRPCYICGELEPYGRFHLFPWHITCDDDDAGRKKMAQWVREQKATKKSEVPTLELPE
jgi:hypothetical protein